MWGERATFGHLDLVSLGKLHVKQRLTVSGSQEMIDLAIAYHHA